MHLSRKMLSGIANIEDPDQTAPIRSSLICVCIVCIWHFVRIGIWKFRTFTIIVKLYTLKGVFRRYSVIFSSEIALAVFLNFPLIQ